VVLNFALSLGLVGLILGVLDAAGNIIKKTTDTTDNAADNLTHGCEIKRSASDTVPSVAVVTFALISAVEPVPVTVSPSTRILLYSVLLTLDEGSASNAVPSVAVVALAVFPAVKTIPVTVSPSTRILLYSVLLTLDEGSASNAVPSEAVVALAVFPAVKAIPFAVFPIAGIFLNSSHFTLEDRSASDTIPAVATLTLAFLSAMEAVPFTVSPSNRILNDWCNWSNWHNSKLLPGAAVASLEPPIAAVPFAILPAAEAVPIAVTETLRAVGRSKSAGRKGNDSELRKKHNDRLSRQ